MHLYDHLVECNAEKNTAKLMGALIRQNKDYEAAELKRLWGCLIDILDSINDTLGEKETDLSLSNRGAFGAGLIHTDYGFHFFDGWRWELLCRGSFADRGLRQ